MFQVQDAVESAARFARNVLGNERTAGLQLEEVDLGRHNDRDAWHITLSMFRPSPFASVTPNPRAPRDYKIFTVDKETGEVLSMKIRELAGVE